MKRIIPMAAAGLFLATAAFATVGPTNPLTVNNQSAVQDTIPTEQTQPTLQKTEEQNPMMSEPTKTDDQPQLKQEKQKTSPLLKEEDSTETDSLENQGF